MKEGYEGHDEKDMKCMKGIKNMKSDEGYQEYEVSAQGIRVRGALGYSDIRKQPNAMSV